MNYANRGKQEVGREPRRRVLRGIRVWYSASSTWILFCINCCYLFMWCSGCGSERNKIRDVKIIQVSNKMEVNDFGILLIYVTFFQIQILQM